MGLCKKFNAQQFLFEAFSRIMRIFGCVEPQTESTVPFQYNTIFETYQSLESSSHTLEHGSHLCLSNFLHGIQCSTTVIWGIFRAASSPKLIYFPIFEYYNTSKDDNLWRPLAPLLGEMDVCAHWLVCTEFNAQQLLFEAYLDLTYVFSSMEP